MSVCGDFGGKKRDGTPCQRSRPDGTRCSNHREDPDRFPNASHIADVGKLGALLNQKQLAWFYGISERTFRKKMEEFPELRAAYQKARALAVSVSAKTILEAVRDAGVPWADRLRAAMFHLKTQGGWSETDRVVHKVEVEEELEKLAKELGVTKDQLRAEAEALARRARMKRVK